ncbi:PREDICTED: uncharacterized protein LOC108780116 [Cyphomyrmex costatus]|uniref:uncharacterized protein LOC108780116 n=1 Tax=Cyphomyrmex costatus TaxID=456900 RepID=UPI00085233B4|nr:PREDICTED: uncharacterized protein LOC108780116 [Cyphomyrmex costatus]
MASTVNIQASGELDFSKPEQWSNWIKRFERYLTVSKLAAGSDKEKIDLLCYSMGERSEEILTQIMPAITTSTTFELVKNKFDSYFRPKKNVIFERFKFNSRKQEAEESVDSFVTALYSLAETCEFGTIKNELIRDRIIIGIRDTRVSEKLQLINDLTVDKALEIARQAETQAREGKRLRQEVEEETKVDRVSQKRRNFPRHKFSNDGETSRRTEQVCGRCGYPNHLKGRKCPAAKSICHKCKKAGHWDRMCRSRGVRRLEDEAEVAYAFIGAATDTTSKIDFKCQAHAREFAKPLHFIIDTGADITCVSEKCIPGKNREKLLRSDKIISGPDGRKLPVIGYLYVTLEREKVTAQSKIYVIRGLKQNLLGKPEIEKFGLIQKINNVKGNNINEIVSKYVEVFKGIGQFKKELSIEVKENTKPHFEAVPRTVPIPLLPKLKKELNKLLKLGIGRFMFTRLPFGINCAPDYFSQMFSELFRDLPNVVVHVDDILIHSSNSVEHSKILETVLARLKKEGITLNRKKCVFGVKQVEFLGHMISREGIREKELILPSRISAIMNLPVPKNKESLLQVLGSLNYVSKYLPDKSHILAPLNSLLQKNTPFEWKAPQQEAFIRIKELLTKAPTLAHYDYHKNIIIQADASSFGIGSALIQEDEHKERKVVAYASRMLTNSEKKYSQIEKEALALTCAVEHFKDFVTGIDITLETDHKPLVQILLSKPLDELTPRLQRIRMRLMRYNYKVTFVPGKQLVLADCLSRNPVVGIDETGKEFTEEIDHYIRFVTDHLPVTQNFLQKIKIKQGKDASCAKLKEYCLNKWPLKDRLPDKLRTYYQFKDKISFSNGFLMLDTRLIISPPLQRELLLRLHEGHLGLNKCRERARQSIWWLGISKQLKYLVENCPNCVEQRSNIKMPFVKEAFPNRPWQKVGVDLFKLDAWYLVIVDYYSRY